MKYCNSCKVNVTGGQPRCPLCQGELEELGGGTVGEEEEVFPVIPTLYRQHHVFFRILIFATVACVVVSLTVNWMIPESGSWSAIVLAAAACLWLTLWIAVQKRKNILKHILWQTFLVSLLSVAWDYFTGWRGWSVDFAVPSICLVAMVSLSVVSRVMKVCVEEYLIYIVLGGLFGIIPLGFLLTGLVKVVYLPMGCVAASVLFLAGILIFQGENIGADLRRRLHL